MPLPDGSQSSPHSPQCFLSCSIPRHAATIMCVIRHNSNKGVQFGYFPTPTYASLGSRNPAPLDSPKAFNSYHPGRTQGRRYPIFSSRGAVDSNWHLLPRRYNNCCILRRFVIYYCSLGRVHSCVCRPQGCVSWPEPARTDLVPSRCISQSSVEEGGLSSVEEGGLSSVEEGGLCFSSQIVSCKVCHKRKELLQLVPLFCRSLLEMCTEDIDFVQLNQLIGRKTGGISVYPLTSSMRGKVDPCTRMIVRGKAMAGRTEDLFNLMNHVILDVQFTERRRFKQFVSQSKKARMESRLRGSGHGFAAAIMDSKLNVAGWISEQMGGISLLRCLLGVTDERRREEILSTFVKDFKEFADAVDTVKEKGVVVAVASPEDVTAANIEQSCFFDVKKVLSGGILEARLGG